MKASERATRLPQQTGCRLFQSNGDTKVTTREKRHIWQAFVDGVKDNAGHKRRRWIATVIFRWHLGSFNGCEPLDSSLLDKVRARCRLNSSL